MAIRPIEKSQDPDLQGLEAALQRAAQRARERARATGTRLVLSRNGKLELLSLEDLAQESTKVAEPQGHYSKHE